MGLLDKVKGLAKGRKKEVDKAADAGKDQLDIPKS
jgi:hypothetical protein